MLIAKGLSQLRRALFLSEKCEESQTVGAPFPLWRPLFLCVRALDSPTAATDGTIDFCACAQ